MGSGERVSLKAMCRERGVDTSGITKVLNDPKIQERIEAAIGTSSIYGLQMATRRLVLMLEDQEDLSVMDLTRITDHLAKLRYGGYARSEESTGPSVAVQINVPPHMDREEAVRVEAREKAKEEFGDSVV